MAQTKPLRCYLNNEDYKALRLASMSGKVNADFTRSSGGDVEFKTKDPHKLCRDLNRVIDPGAVTWHEIFDLPYTF